MACNCSEPCQCPTVSVAPPVVGEPGPPNVLTVGTTVLSPGDPPSVSISGVSPNQHLQFLLSPGATGDAGPAGPAGANGAAGANGVSRYTSLDADFVVPAVGSTVPITVGSTVWMSVGEWIYIRNGGWFVVQSIDNATQATVRNPGPADLAPASGVPQNAAVGVTVSDLNNATQVGSSGRLGPAGAAGDPGPTLDPSVVYVVPSSPPSGPEDYLRVYFNAAPPSIPTVGQFYTWDGAAWVAGPNFVSQGGTTTYTGVADPNVAPPAGSKVLDLYIQFVGSNAVYWQRTAPSTWVVVGTVALMGTPTTSVTWTTGPGTYTLDLATFSYDIQADSDIELDWDDTNYTGQGAWTVLLNNNSGAAAINVSFATGRWNYLKSLPVPATPALSLPDTETVVIQFVRDSFGAVYTVTSFDTLLAV